MAKTKYCVLCERYVVPRKELNLFWLVVATPIYVPYYLFFKKKSCPVCKGTEFIDRKPIDSNVKLSQ